MDQTLLSSVQWIARGCGHARFSGPLFTVFVHDRLKFGLWGWIGVDLFLVLSGFLITGILYDSLHDPNYFRNFYIRRSLRIFPLFYGFFLLLFVLKPLLHLVWQNSLLGFFLYVGNLMVPFYPLQTNNPTYIMQAIPGHPAQLVCNIGHLWSLCVEEQFYLLWPAVIYLVRDRKKLIILCGGLIVSVLLVRAGVRVHLGERAGDFPLLFYWSTYFRCDTLLMGSFAALYLRSHALSLRSLRRLSAGLIGIPGSIFFAGLYLVQHVHPDIDWILRSMFVTTAGFTLIGLTWSGVLLLSLDESNILSRTLKMKALSRLGAISYGVYFFHALPEVLLRRVVNGHPRLGTYAPYVMLAAVTALAAVSFRFYESPFLKLKARFAPSAGKGRQHKSPPPLLLREKRLMDEARSLRGE